MQSLFLSTLNIEAKLINLAVEREFALSYLYFLYLYLQQTTRLSLHLSFLFFPSHWDFPLYLPLTKGSGDFRMSDFGGRVVKVPGTKSTNSHILKMKDPIGTCSVSISLKKPLFPVFHNTSIRPSAKM